MFYKNYPTLNKKEFKDNDEMGQYYRSLPIPPEVINRLIELEIDNRMLKDTVKYYKKLAGF